MYLCTFIFQSFTKNIGPLFSSEILGANKINFCISMIWEFLIIMQKKSMNLQKHINYLELETDLQKIQNGWELVYIFWSKNLSDKL